MFYQLHRRQVVGGTLAEVFEFFKDPYNLEAITPPWLGFRILEATDRPVRVGTRIRYALRLHGVPLRWESRISDFVDGAHFSDEQVVGPYRSWHHAHRFCEVPGGVAVEDIVQYEMPLGILGRLAHVVSVQRQLKAIFDYRECVIGERFPFRAAGVAISA